MFVNFFFAGYRKNYFHFFGFEVADIEGKTLLGFITLASVRGTLPDPSVAPG